MKKVLLTLFPLLLILTAKAQVADSARNSDDKVVTVNSDAIFTSVEHIPEFPGGISELYKFLAKNVRYPRAALEHKTQGRVIVTMVVEKDGLLSQVQVVRSIGDGCDEEAVRVVKLSSPWKPGIQNGHPVRVQYSMPVSFMLDK